MPALIAMIAIKGAAYAVRHVMKLRGISNADATKAVLKVAADESKAIAKIKNGPVKYNKSVGARDIDKAKTPLTEQEKKFIRLKPQDRVPAAGKNNTTIQYGEKVNLSSDAKIAQARNISKNKGNSTQEINKAERAKDYLIKYDKAQIYKDKQKGVK